MVRLDHATTRLRAEIAAERFWRAASALRIALRHNPWWHLQPRVPSGVPEDGRWTFGQLVAGLPLVLLRWVAPAAVRLLRERARQQAPLLRRLPKRWEELESLPSADDFVDETRRIGPPSAHRPGSPLIRFNSEEELRRFLGPAGPGREWHHMVEKQLAGWRFPNEVIHSTDNIINLPVEVHRRINAAMQWKAGRPDGRSRREWIEDLNFGDQYNLGLGLIEEIAKELGYEYARY